MGGGNYRSSSGGETRLIRSVYGNNEFYTQLAMRSMQIFKDFEHDIRRKILFETGNLWFVDKKNDIEIQAAIGLMEKYGIHYEILSQQDIMIRFPLVCPRKRDYFLLEKNAGYLLAREITMEVVNQFIKYGGNYTCGEVKPGTIENNTMHSLLIQNERVFENSFYIFACGPWLKTIFPDLLGTELQVTKQEVFFFGLTEEEATHYEKYPTWIDMGGKEIYYGIPSDISRGFKIASDTRGESFNPTNGNRVITPKNVEKAKNYIKKTFAYTGELPLIQSRVCQYENTINGNFIIDNHPMAADNVLIVGGGSGHGFKHGPAIGELILHTLQAKKPVYNFYVSRSKL